MLGVYGKPIHVSPPAIPPLIRLPMTSEPSVATTNSSGSRSILFLKAEGVSVGLGSVSALTHNAKTSARVRPSGCVEAHMRELLERGFEVAVVKDATAGSRHPELGDGYQAALVNFGYMANEVVTTEEIVSRLEEGTRQAA